MTQPADLQPYLESACTHITGPLALVNMASTVTPTLLRAALGSVTHIDGGLVVSGNPYLVTLDFLAALRSTAAVYVVNNDALVDARMPLLNASAPMQVAFNRRLCPLNFPLASGSCGLVDVVAVAAVDGLAAAAFQTSQAQITALLTDAVTPPAAHVCTLLAGGV